MQSKWLSATASNPLLKACKCRSMNARRSSPIMDSGPPYPAINGAFPPPFPCLNHHQLVQLVDKMTGIATMTMRSLN